MKSFLKNRFFFVIILIYITSFLNAANSHKATTFLVYMSADNSLYPYASFNISQMAKVGSNENLNVLVYLNIKYPGKNKTTMRLEIQKGKVVTVSIDPWQDGGSPLTVQKALLWAIQDYPSDNLILVFWDHGSGSLNRNSNYGYRSVCYDDTTGNRLIDTDLVQSLSYACQLRGGKKVDIVSFDACLMAGIEIANTLAPYVNYMVASQQTIPGNGFPYDRLLSGLVNNNMKMSAINMVSAYKTEYNGQVSDYTLSVLDLSAINALSQNIDAIGSAFFSLLTSSGSKTIIKKMIQASSNTKVCTSFDDPCYLDLGHLYTNFTKNINALKLRDANQINYVKTLLTTGISLLKKVVITQAHGPVFPNANGLSIYLEQNQVDPTYADLLWVQTNRWYTFLQQYVIS